MKFAAIFFVGLGIVACSAHTLHLKNPDSRIVGGEETVPNDYPSVLNLGYHGCAATLIDPKWALTAAHCNQIDEVVGGDHTINVFEGTEQRRRVINTIRHPDYQNPGPFSNDVALLELESPFEITDFVQTVGYAAADLTPTGDAIIVGWGTTAESGTFSDVLRDATLQFVTQEVCTAAYGTDIDDSMICAEATDSGFCQGDSGGPMFCNDANNVLVHCGIASWSRGCAAPSYPGVFSRTSQFRAFIDSYINPTP